MCFVSTSNVQERCVLAKFQCHKGFEVMTSLDVITSKLSDFVCEPFLRLRPYHPRGPAADSCNSLTANQIEVFLSAVLGAEFYFLCQWY